jgi:multidrug transporter EmrE-like cation transporter
MIFLVFSFTLNAGSYVFYKYSSNNSGKRVISSILLLSGLMIGALNAFFYTKSLKGIKLSIAYPVFSAASIFLVSLISVVLFKEIISTRKAIGIGVILVGVVLVAM